MEDFKSKKIPKHFEIPEELTSIDKVQIDQQKKKQQEEIDKFARDSFVQSRFNARLSRGLESQTPHTHCR